jgi:hypothetical protein
VEGERYLYLPSVFFCTWLIVLLHQTFNIKVVAGTSAIILYSFVYYVAQSRTYYMKAGAISKATMDEISKCPNKKIFLSNLPQNNKGAVLFRIGLEDGLQWTAPNNNDTVLVVSIEHDDSTYAHSKDFDIVYSSGKKDTLISKSIKLDQRRFFPAFLSCIKRCMDEF